MSPFKIRLLDHIPGSAPSCWEPQRTNRAMNPNSSLHDRGEDLETKKSGLKTARSVYSDDCYKWNRKNCNQDLYFQKRTIE